MNNNNNKKAYSVISTLNGAPINALQKLGYDGMQETHVLSSANGKTIHAEVSHHFRYAFKRLAELTKDKGVHVLVPLDPHVHEAPGTPAKNPQTKERLLNVHHLMIFGENSNSIKFKNYN